MKSEADKKNNKSKYCYLLYIMFAPMDMFALTYTHISHLIYDMIVK